MSGTQHNLCKKCYGECRPSKAFQYTLLETCDPQGNPEGILATTPATVSFDRREEKEIEYKVGQRALRRSQSGHDLHDTWKVFTVNETYMQLIRDFPNDYKPLEFTHYWVNGFGWENTVYQPYEFHKVEKLGENKEGVIFLAENEFGTKHIFLKSNI